MKAVRFVSFLVLISMVVTACSSGAATSVATTEAPTSAATLTPVPAIQVTPVTPVITPTVAATSAITPTVVPTEAPTAAPVVTPTVAVTGTSTASAAVVPIPESALVQKGKLTICTDFPYPPQEFFDENGTPQGLDVEIGNEIAKRLNLTPQYVNSVFDSIIAAVTSGKCDIIISAMNITKDRNKQVSMIPYFRAGQSFVAQKGNPQNINTPLDLCGKSVAAESGTTEVAYLEGTGDYVGKGLTQDCTKNGKAAINVVVTQKDSDALQQLQSGKVVAYFADSPVAAYYTVQHPDQFQLVGQVLEPIDEGINMPCGQADCTKAPLSPVGTGIKSALDSMMADGTYAKILAKWNLSDGAVTPTK